jgi:predicted ATPase
MESMVNFLQSLRAKFRDPEATEDGYPFDIPVVQSLDTIEFRSPVTFFVGENGSGKSTMLEAIAAAAGSITIGGESIQTDPTLTHARRLAAQLTLGWARRTHRGFFMRSEDFFNYALGTRRMIEELDEQAAGYAAERLRNPERSYGLGLAEGVARGQRAALSQRYGEDLNARSHGESFFQVFQARFVPGGLYLLDEPDTALSPQRQLALLALLKEMVAQDAQFIIATHAPILLAYPDAAILSFDGGTIAETRYDEVANVELTRRFLSDPAAYLRWL